MHESKTTVREIRRYIHHPSVPAKGRILMVVSSPALSEVTGWPIGFWASELTHPLAAFTEAGYMVDLASTQGGAVSMDGYSNPTDASGFSAHDVLTLGYLHHPPFNEMLANTAPIAEVDATAYAAIFLVGGQGPMYTFTQNPDLERLFCAFYEAGKPCAAVCHASAFLLTARTSAGALVVDGKTWTGFSDAEEDVTEQAVGSKVQPFRIETEARKLPGTQFKTEAAFTGFAIRDGNLITGQQQNSGTAAAACVLEALAEMND